MNYDRVFHDVVECIFLVAKKKHVRVDKNRLFIDQSIQEQTSPKGFSAIFRQSKFNIESSISSAILRVRGPSFRQWPTRVHICCSLQLRDKWRRLKILKFSTAQTDSIPIPLNLDCDVTPTTSLFAFPVLFLRIEPNFSVAFGSYT